MDQEPVKANSQLVNAEQTAWPELGTYLWNFGTTIRIEVLT